jgi:hypothetical protein
MRPDPFDPNRSSSSGDREPYAYERERLITERERHGASARSVAGSCAASGSASSY